MLDLLNIFSVSPAKEDISELFQLVVECTRCGRRCGHGKQDLLGAYTIVLFDGVLAGFALLGEADALKVVGDFSNFEDGAGFPCG